VASGRRSVMAGAIDVSRRAFLTGLAGLAAARAMAADPPRIDKRVERLFKIKGATQPNDLQFVADGLWVLDQVDPNKAFKVRPEDGTVIRELQTESIQGSGITYGHAAHAESRSGERQDDQVVGDAGVGLVRPRHDAVRWPWREVGR
jgi:hypothetical protein